MISIKILTQPNDTSCGPTSLHAIYDYYGDQISLSDVIAQVPTLEEGGTSEVMLACHALRRGYQALIYTYNLKVFDPTWFTGKADLTQKLNDQLPYKTSPRLHRASKGYLEFLSLGGEIRFEDLRPSLLKRYFKENTPVLAGLSATYLYKTSREYTTPNHEVIYNDVKGYPSGHFVVLCGYDHHRKHIIVADPYGKNTISGDNYYSVGVGRLINSIMLAIVTYDASLLIIKPGQK